MDVNSVSLEVGGRTLTIETGKLAKQADGSAFVSYGDTRVLVTACCAKEPREGFDFFPLTVEYSEKFYAAGKIPGGFFKREGRPTSDAILSCRLIDRPIRPLFPEGYKNETQIVATIMSLDHDCDPNIAAAVGTSAALSISESPFSGPTAACRIGRVDGKFVVNPTHDQLTTGKSDMDIFVAGTAKAVTMVEGGADEVPEDQVLEAILLAHREITKICEAINELKGKAGKPKQEFVAEEIPADILSGVKASAEAALKTALQTKDKGERYTMVGDAKKATVEALVSEEEVKADKDEAKKKEKFVKTAFEDLQYELMREMILSDGVRIDGRDLKTIRPIWCETGLLPRAHGSSVFTRGETQVLAAVTLGTADDEQMVDNLAESTKRRFMLHYNFPPYSVGECGRVGFTSRREVGHGNLAERSVHRVIPSNEEFPYTLRVVCETLESNGSSSMGSVCSSSMALMHAGVPLKKPVAGIAMGLIKEGDRVAVLSDILGDEDHLGDMDFKVAGTKDGITGIQMDIKIEGVTEEIMRTALSQAQAGRMHILQEMSKAIEVPNEGISDYAPRITTIKIPVDKIRDVIGTGGKVIKEIISVTGCKVEVQDDGTVNVASSDGEAAKKAVDWIRELTAEAEHGATYPGVVKRVVDFGAFVEIMPNTEGLLHISEIAHERVNVVEDYLKEGDEVEVKVIEIDDRSGKIRLSRKALLELPEGYTPPPPREGRGDRDRGRGGRGGERGRGDRGGRGGDRGGRGGGRGGDRGGRGGDRGGRR